LYPELFVSLYPALIALRSRRLLLEHSESTVTEFASFHAPTLFVEPTNYVCMTPAKREVGAKMGGRWESVRLGSHAAKNGGRGDLEDGGKVVGVEVFRWRQVHALYSHPIREARQNLEASQRPSLKPCFCTL